MMFFRLLQADLFSLIVCLFRSGTVCDVLHSICSESWWCDIPLAEIQVLRAV